MARPVDVLMLLENQPYPADVRVRAEAGSLCAAGLNVLVIAPRAPGEPDRETVDGVAVERFDLPASDGAGAAALAREYLRANLHLHLRGARALLRGARVLHLHNPPDTLWPIAALARALGRLVIYDQHDLVPELTGERFASRLLQRAARVNEALTFRLADRVIVPNESHREIAITRGRIAAPRVSVVRNGPRRRTLAADPAPRAGRLRDPRICFLGSMAPQDGVTALPDLLARLRDDHGLDRAQMTLIGDGPARADLAGAFADAGLADAVALTGRVAHHQVPGLLAQADICVDPAGISPLNDRSTMVKIAEYLAAGRPVVAYGLTETRRTAADAAVYAPPGDLDALAGRVAELAADERSRLALARRARARAEALVWEHSEAELLRAYRGVLPSR